MAAAPSYPLVTYDPDQLKAAARALGLRLVLLFGSRSTGSPPPTPESDLDVAVLAGRSEAGRSFRSCYRALSEVFGDFSLDLVLLHDADPLLRYEVVQGGTLLYGDPVDYLEYKAFAYRDFTDSSDLRALEETLFQKKMAYLRSVLYAAA